MQTHDCLIVATPNRFKHYRNAADEFICLQPKWKESEEEEWGWEGESTEEEKEEEEEAEAMPEAEVKVDVEEQEDLKQEENVLKEEEEDHIYQINLKGGRGPIFTQEQDQEIINMVLANNAIRLREIQANIISDHAIFNNVHQVS